MADSLDDAEKLLDLLLVFQPTWRRAVVRLYRANTLPADRCTALMRLLREPLDEAVAALDVFCHRLAEECKKAYGADQRAKGEPR